MSDAVDLPLPNETDNLLNIRDVDAPVPAPVQVPVPVPAPPVDMNVPPPAARHSAAAMMDMMEVAPAPVNLGASPPPAPVNFGGANDNVVVNIPTGLEADATSTEQPPLQPMPNQTIQVQGQTLQLEEPDSAETQDENVPPTSTLEESSPPAPSQEELLTQPTTTATTTAEAMTTGEGMPELGTEGNQSFDSAPTMEEGNDDNRTEAEQPSGDNEESRKRAAEDSETDDPSLAKKFKTEIGTAGDTATADSVSILTGMPKKKPGRKPGSLNKKKSMSSYGSAIPSWNDMFFALMAFKAKLGTFNVPAQTKLGKWVTKQRQEYSKLQRKKISYHQCNELSEERIQVLNSLGFIWDTMLHENGRRWNQRFEELKQWKEEHGHCNVPQSTSLGQWVKIQRENKREADLKAAGKLPQRTKPKPCLAPDRIDKLNAIGFQWRVAAPVTGWDNRYNQLLEYAKAHNGDVNVPQYFPADKAFGRWVMKQRSEYSLRLRGLKSQLTDERVDKLNAIGFSWVAPNFKRKVGVGIAPGSPAANVAAAMHQNTSPSTENGVPKLPPMEKNLLGETNEVVHNPTPVPQPVPAAATAAPATQPPQAPAPPQQTHHDQHQPPQMQQQPQPTVPQQPSQQQQQQHSQASQAQPQPPPAPQLVHHQHPSSSLDSGDGYQALQHDPHQHQHAQQVEHHQHLHHMNPHHAPDQQPHTMHPHHPQHQDALGEDVVNMEFM